MHTHYQPKSSPKPPKSPARSTGSVPPALSTRFTPKELLSRFRKVLPPRLLSAWFAGAPHTFYERAFTLRIVLWYFLFQRLGSNRTLSHALTDAMEGGADGLSPRGKALSQQLHSTATTALSDARQRLPRRDLQEALQHSALKIHSWVKGFQWHGWTVALLDGSTFRLRPYGNIAHQFPPHRSAQNKYPYWCLVRVVVAFCLNTGLVLNCTLGAARLSEQVLAAQLLAQSWTGTLFVADRNFGVYSVVRAAQAASAQILFRLTQLRAAKLAREAKVPLRAGLDVSIFWNPSPQDKCPAGLTPEPVRGRLLVVRVQRPGFRPLLLYLFTTLTDVQQYGAGALAQLYGQRWHVELNLRYVKTQMELESLECKSAEMACKEWLAGLLAYNLIRSLMVASAARNNLSVLILSFSRTRDLLLAWLLRHSAHPQVEPWERLLDRVGRCCHPKRSKPRPAEPRAIRYFKRDIPRLAGDRAKARQQLAIANAKLSKN